MPISLVPSPPAASAHISVRGRVVVEQDGATATTPRINSKMRPFLLDTAKDAHDVLATSLKPDATFEIQVSHDGVYFLAGFGPETNGDIFDNYMDYYIASSRQGGRDVLRDGLLVSQVTESFEMVLSPAGGVLQGTVRTASGMPVHDAVVALISDASLRQRSDRSHTYRTERTDQNGTFEIHGMVPGTYSLYAWRSADVRLNRASPFLNPVDITARFSNLFRSAVEDGAFMDAGFMRQFESSAQTVVIEKGARKSVNLRVVEMSSSPARD